MNRTMFEESCDEAMAQAQIESDFLNHVRSSLDYDPTTGEFKWIETQGSAKAGRVAGSLMQTGYWVIRVNRTNYMAHRLAWLHVHGKWPDGVIDHINGIKTDNRMSNLRDTTQAINVLNQHKLRRDNKSGLAGVSLDRCTQKWKAQIQIRGKGFHLGLFASKADAHAAYLSAKRVLHESLPF